MFEIALDFVLNKKASAVWVMNIHVIKRLPLPLTVSQLRLMSLSWGEAMETRGKRDLGWRHAVTPLSLRLLYCRVLEAELPHENEISSLSAAEWKSPSPRPRSLGLRLSSSVVVQNSMGPGSASDRSSTTPVFSPGGPFREAEHVLLGDSPSTHRRGPIFGDQSPAPIASHLL